eukprot:CAMPEP_0180534546 /NCGR_PEP_ID=MMETSP1036_2-20121128/64239_1 /TAXON_ID=632150 /ORGANISM="Azadinium spinosum, Strain 3D9" /LENGTH=206 /DNA_ID=CAMNT_0022548879 /DNA_START=379 /DNA_END=996 /DNA_ORIENTATION=-
MTLYMSISGGMDWGDCWELIAPLELRFRIVFIVFISFSVFALLNIVTGVFVESTLSSATYDRNTIIEDEKNQQSQYISMMIDLFEEMDTNETGQISFDEFEAQLKDERALTYFAALHLDISEVRTLFTLLDLDHSGSIDMDEFLLGCKKLSGESRALDIAVLQLEIKWLMKCLSGFADFVEVELMGQVNQINAKLHLSGLSESRVP